MRMRLPRFNDRQLDRLSEFSSNFSLIIVAALIIPNIVGVDKPNMIEVLSGLVIAILLLVASLILLRKIYD